MTARGLSPVAETFTLGDDGEDVEGASLSASCRALGLE
jgi:hypothetical protein